MELKTDCPEVFLDGASHLLLIVSNSYQVRKFKCSMEAIFWVKVQEINDHVTERVVFTVGVEVDHVEDDVSTEGMLFYYAAQIIK